MKQEFVFAGEYESPRLKYAKIGCRRYCQMEVGSPNLTENFGYSRIVNPSEQEEGDWGSNNSNN